MSDSNKTIAKAESKHTMTASDAQIVDKFTACATQQQLQSVLTKLAPTLSPEQLAMIREFAISTTGLFARWQSLPSQLLRLCFSFLDDSSLLLVVERVCSQWSSESKNGGGWERWLVTQRLRSCNNRHMITWLRSSPKRLANTRELRYPPALISGAVVLSCRRLESLTVDMAGFMRCGVKTLAGCAATMHTLCFNGTLHKYRGFNLVELAETVPNLASLELPRETTEEHIKGFAGFAKLRSVSLVSTYCPPRCLTLLPERLMSLTFLPSINPPNYEDLFQALSRFSSLSVLALAAIQSDKLHLFDSLPCLHNRTLNSLSFRLSRYSRTIMYTIPACLSFVSEITLSESFLSENDVQQIAARMPNLTSLSLGEISDATQMNEFVKAIITMSKLQSLALSYVSAINDNGLVMLAKLPSLRKLKVWKCQNVTAIPTILRNQIDECQLEIETWEDSAWLNDYR